MAIGLLPALVLCLPAAPPPGDIFSYHPGAISFQFTKIGDEPGFEVYELTFPSPIQRRWPEVNRVYATVFLPDNRPGPVPVVIALHTFGSKKARFCFRLMRALAARGIAGVQIDMPFHRRRLVAGACAGGMFIGRTPEDTLLTARQVVVECRALVDFLCQRPEFDARRIGIAGFSLGGSMGALVFAVERRIRAAALVGGGTDPAYLIWHSGLLYPIRRAMEDRGITFARMQQALAPIDIRNLAATDRRKDVLLIDAIHDFVVPKHCAEALWQAFGRPRIIWLNSGHFSMFAHPDKINCEIIRFLMTRFGLGGPYAVGRYRGETLKLAIIRGDKTGTAAAILCELAPLDRRGRACFEVGVTSRGYGLAGVSVRVIHPLSVGVGIPLFRSPATAEPYVSLHLSF